MKIINSNADNLNAIFDIYNQARDFMIKNNNQNQWKELDKVKEKVIIDIKNHNHYSIYQKDTLVGVFSFIIGIDPTYNLIKGKWLNDLEYGTIHRIASGNNGHNILKETLNYCFKKINNIRIDTHPDNSKMLYLLNKYEFIKCGIIYLEDKSERIAYQTYLK